MAQKYAAGRVIAPDPQICFICRNNTFGTLKIIHLLSDYSTGKRTLWPPQVRRQSTILSYEIAIVGVELVAIAYIRYHYFKMSFWLSVLQVIFGGALVLVAGLVIGRA